MTATGLKEAGDDLYKQGKYQEAIVKYSLSIDRCTNPQASEIHLAYSNRCACYMHLGQYEKALEDANVCVAMKPTWIKGYSRKASCLESLNRIQDAIQCYEKVLQFDRSNAEANGAILRLSRSQQQGNRQPQPQSAAGSSSGSTGSGASVFSGLGNFGGFDWRRMTSTVLDQLTYYYYRCLTWWQDLSPNTKLYIQCGVLIVFLYYMFFRPSGYSSYDGYGSSYGYGGYGGYGYGGYGYGYGGGMSWTTWGLIMLAAYKLPPMFPELLGEQLARPFFGLNWTTFMWLLNMFSRNTGRMGGFGGYGGYGMPGGMFGPRRRYY